MRLLSGGRYWLQGLILSGHGVRAKSSLCEAVVRGTRTRG